MDEFLMLSDGSMHLMCSKCGPKLVAMGMLTVALDRPHTRIYEITGGHSLDDCIAAARHKDHA